MCRKTTQKILKWCKNLRCKGMQISNLVDLEKNAPTLALGGADTAENGQSKVLQVSNKIRRILAMP